MLRTTLWIILIILSINQLKGQDVISYSNFKKSYKPHNGVLNPELGKLFVDFGVEHTSIMCEVAIETNSENGISSFTEIITSIPRTMASEVIDKMKEKNQVMGINSLKDEWALDLIYYMTEPTYNRISGQLKALKNYDNSNQKTKSFQSGDQANKYWDQGKLLYDQGKYVEAIPLFKKSLEAETANPNPRLAFLAKTINISGTCYSMIGQHERAIKLHEYALEIARKLKDVEVIAIVLYDISYDYKAQKQFDKAIKSYNEALEGFRILEQDGKIASNLYNIGSVYLDWGQYDKALRYYKESLVLFEKSKDEENIAKNLIDIGLVYNAWEEYNKALEYYEKALTILRKLGIEEGVASSLYNIGSVYQSWGKDNKAFGYYEESLAIFKKLKNQEGAAETLNNLGLVYYALGQYDKAIECFKEALTIHRELGNEINIAGSLSNIGSVYQDWGVFNKAVSYYEEALLIIRKSGQNRELSTLLNNIGSVYQSLGYDKKAMSSYKESLAISKKLGNTSNIAGANYNVGSIYHKWEQYDKAIEFYENAVTAFRKLGNESSVALCLSYIGMAYVARFQYEKGIKFLEESLEISRKLGRERDVALSLYHIGGVYYLLENYSKAIKNFEESIKIKEKLRKTASGKDRRDYLASQINSYQFLTSSYVRIKDFRNTYNSVELSRARLLSEQIAEPNSDLTSPSIERIQDELPIETAILIYANANWQDKILMVITREASYSAEISDKNLVMLLMKKYGASIQEMTKTRHRFMLTMEKKHEDVLRSSVKKSSEFDNIISYYRFLLNNPTEENNRNAKDIGRTLYELLISPMSDRIINKNKLIIIPDGILGFLPFETLIDRNEHYWVETYDIAYIQSMSVLELLKNRKYKGSRKPLLAFGGAVYDEVTFAVEMIENESQFSHLMNKIYSTFVGRESFRNTYASLGVGHWSNLPGTLKEVKEIKKTIKGAEIITGKEVSEHKIKALSANGDLTNYKVLHFATHGLFMPTIPELSALVLSQFKDEQGNEDGYLRMDEIAKLNLQADFVNLSACETGLGEIYGGEGIVGLTHSFLIAGANGLSVSLWQVADESTSQFMVAMYELAQTKDIGYADAIMEIKRRFIKGDFVAAYKAPYYWAPFVYYGQYTQESVELAALNNHNDFKLMLSIVTGLLLIIGVVLFITQRKRKQDCSLK